MNKLDAVIVQDSFLLTALQNKSAEKLAYNDYMDIFLAFKKLVSQDVKFICQVFPEYTPHEEEFHLRRLLGLAEEILGRELIERLNATELLILCLSIFGHDWGMAVSQTEKDVIAEHLGSSPYDYALLKSEHSRFARHLEIFNEKADKISDFTWQEYIRKTHAERSAQRVRNYFKKIDNGIGEAAARVCIGHWLDFKEMRDQDDYPLNYIVKGERVNLRAVAIYLRLIDLFDITNERTPYAIYKYTAPQSYRSKMEWSKHFAINSLATVAFQNGRLIQVDGQTSDYKVYAELEDLRTFCLEQLVGCNDLLKDDPGERYYLNIFDIKWNVRALGFDPILIKFQFDRMKMFDVLSEEIYSGDKYVFIRELVQNSIDAIRMRKEWIEKNTGATVSNFGRISIEVEEAGDDLLTVSIKDDGIGMDQYIIENYLSIAGKSYYGSDEFKQLGLEMDPISKFGVGILSCFMVADKVQISTFKDPQIKRDSKVISVDIPHVDQQFRVSATNHEYEPVGTTVTVYVSKNKIRDKVDEDPQIDITSYLKNLMGYIDFPIYIMEGGNSTVIVDPLDKTDSYPGYEVHRLDTSVDFSKIFLPQSLKLAKEHFTVKQISIHDDLKMEGVAGSVSFIIPKDPFLKIADSSTSNKPEYSLLFPGKRTHDRIVKIKSVWASYKHANPGKEYPYGQSSYSTEPFKVYLDGILVPKAIPPSSVEAASFEGNPSEDFFDYYPMERFIVPQLHVQFTKNHIRQTDISRTEIRQQEYFWDEALAQKLHQYIIKIHKEELMDTDLKKRMMYINYLIFFYRVPLSAIIKFIGLDNAPLMIVNDEGSLKLDIWKNYMGRSVYFQPAYTYWFREVVLKEFDEQYKLDENLLDWRGDAFVISDISYPELYRKRGSLHAVTGSLLAQSYISLSHTFCSFRFVESPWLGGPPLIQAKWDPSVATSSPEYFEILTKAAENINSLEQKYFEQLIYEIREELYEYIDVFPKIGPFEEPYRDALGYGVGILNQVHPFTKGLLRILANIAVFEQKPMANSAEVAQMIDKVMELPFFDHNTYFDHEFLLNETNMVIDEINGMIERGKLIKNYEPLEHISIDQFVDETLFEADNGNYYQFFNLADKGDYGLNPFYSETM
ncbi:ATP-binding protein [uncultured Chryseobacterium sp.]|uniref:HD domain-containing protein n=1 Tax=uncultured Chryseobacterium sp. TaxID=259322 RepID=UPI002583B573|nr:ATP-binding protein [uncultured Chryseobacterium sp.]